jgi:methylated-DNA-[protein]-cysteine S-methyltransferase
VTTRADSQGPATLSWACLSTPVGPLSVGCSTAGVAGVRFGRPPASQDRASQDRASQDGASQDGASQDGLAELARQQLAEYFAGRRAAFELPLDWQVMPEARRRVLQVLFRSVGYGQTISYGALAARAGLSSDDGSVPARTVGQIMGGNPIPVIVPCHRVLASGGLGGYSGGAGPEVKRWLLILEGALPPTLDWQPATPAVLALPAQDQL